MDVKKLCEAFFLVILSLSKFFNNFLFGVQFVSGFPPRHANEFNLCACSFSWKKSRLARFKTWLTHL